MSFENKGSMGPTVTITAEPDRRGNFVCDGTNDYVELQAAVDLLEAGNGGVIILGSGDFTLGDEVLFTGAGVTPTESIIIKGSGMASTTINTAASEYGFRFINCPSVWLSDMSFVLPASNAQPAIFGDDGGATVYSLYRGRLENLKVSGGASTNDLHCIHLQNPLRWEMGGNIRLEVDGASDVTGSSGIRLENTDAGGIRGDGFWDGYMHIRLGANNAKGIYITASSNNFAHLVNVAEIYIYGAGYTTTHGVLADSLYNSDLYNFRMEDVDTGFQFDNCFHNQVVGGYFRMDNGGILFDVNSTCQNMRFLDIRNISCQAAETLTVMDDDVGGAASRSIYRNLYVAGGAGSTVNWLPHGVTVIKETIWIDSGTAKYSEKSGTASVTGAVNTVAVTHGLITTPEVVYVTPLQTGSGDTSASDKTATDFDIDFENQPGGDTWYFDWFAYYRPM